MTEIKFAENDKWRVRAVCKFNKKCGYTIFVSRVVRTTTFRVGTICPEHTCGRVCAKKSFKSKQVAKVVVKHDYKEEQPAIQQLPIAAPKKRARPKEKTSSNVKPNERTMKKTNNRLHARSTSKKTKGLEKQQPKVLVDVEPLNRNQELRADGEPLEPISAMKLVSTTADPVPSDEKKRKKKVTRKLDLKKVRTSDRLRTLTFKRVYDGPGRDATSPIVINDNDYDDDAEEDGKLHDPKIGSCMHALRSCDEISKSLTKIHSSCFV